MKVLWLSNRLLSQNDPCSTGTWLDTMAQVLVSSGEVTLGNIAFGPVKDVTRQDYGPVRQWAVPDTLSLCEGLPPPRYLSAILKAVDSYSPDLVHVWGTEYFWGLLTARKLIPYPSLLGIQGLKFAIAPVFSGGLSNLEQLLCIGIKEFIHRSSIFQMRKRYEKWGVMEKEIIAGHNFIAALLRWALSHIRTINKTSTLFQYDYILRQPFYQAPPHSHVSNNKILCIAAYPSPFKGLHVAVRAIRLLRNKFPDIELRIAGNHQQPGIRQDGYIAWMNREIYRLGMRSKVIWLGTLSAEKLVGEMHNCSAVVVPSFIESYCLAMAEAMFVGMPIVSSYAGNMPDLAHHNDSALFFPPGDASACAGQLEKILADRELASRLSKSAREKALIRHDPKKILKNQLRIYHQVLSESNADQMHRFAILASNREKSKVKSDEGVVVQQ
jgi:glycosyltransferase involved in cell wall biosynthesis